MSGPLRGSRYWVSGFPDLVEQWDYERNGIWSPETVTAGAGRLLWWRCPKGNDHVWRAKPNNRTRGAGCPFCANRRVSGTNNLAVLFPRIAAEWHPTKNGHIGPSAVLAGSSRICFWRCRKRPEHEWRAGVRDRTRGHRGCPYCLHRRVSREESLAEVHPAIAAEWDPTNNGTLTPCDVTPGSGRTAFWLCRANSGHRWSATITNRVLRASGCPHCARQRRRAVPLVFDDPATNQTSK
jgi:hypothetical protein